MREICFRAGVFSEFYVCAELVLPLVLYLALFTVLNSILPPKKEIMNSKCSILNQKTSWVFQV